MTETNTQAGPSGPSDDDERAISIARRIDEVAADAPTWMHLVLGLRKALSIQQQAEIDFAPSAGHPVDDAAIFAFSYNPSFESQGRPRFTLEPWHKVDEEEWPPPLASVSPTIAQHWPHLARLVNDPMSRARLYATSFLRGGPQRIDHAQGAISASLQAASTASREMDSIDQLHIALRIARAIKDQTSAEQALHELLDVAQRKVDEPKEPLGMAIRALQVAAREPSCPPRVDSLLEQICAAPANISITDQALRLMLQRATDEKKAVIWRRLVEAHRNDALAADAPLVRTIKLRSTLQLAQSSSSKELSSLIAADLQKCAEQELGLVAYHASSAQFEEEISNVIDSMIAGDSWQQALISFARFPSISGDTDKNRDIIRQQQTAYPLLSLFPPELLGPDGLPAYTATSPEDLFDIALVRWETDLIGNWMRLLVRGLHAIPQRHTSPQTSELREFLHSWPGFAGRNIDVVALALQRFWNADADGAAYTAITQIERIVRTLVVLRGVGAYQAQREQRPGQFVGLGSLLPMLQDAYDIPESRIRLYSASLTHPAGLNLRNLLLHGFHGIAGSDIAALVLHLLLYLGTVAAPAAAADPPSA